MKFLLVVILSFLLKVSNAQQASIAFTGGINISNQNPVYTVEINGQSKNIKGESIQKFNVGDFMDFTLGKNFDFRAQALYSVMGFKTGYVQDPLGNNLQIPTKFTLNYINLPIQLLYMPKVSFGKVFFGLGPYLSNLISGKINSTMQSRNIKIGNSKDDDFKRFDFGIYNSAGIELKNGFFAGASYLIGLTDATSQGKNKNYVLSFFAGYKVNIHIIQLEGKRDTK